MQGATPWSYRACVAECDLWRDLGAQSRWIRRVDGLDCDMPMRFLRPFAKWSHDGSGRSCRDRCWQSGPEICPFDCILISVSFSGFLLLGDHSYRVLLHVEDTRVKTQCGVQCEVGPCRTLVKHLDKAGTDRMFAPRGV